MNEYYTNYIIFSNISYRPSQTYKYDCGHRQSGDHTIYYTDISIEIGIDKNIICGIGIYYEVSLMKDIYVEKHT